ncbi:MAG TPA: glycosyltransferase family 39 protein [bacterium]|nr:glycosyltransferase family 39 protein [bacterium]
MTHSNSASHPQSTHTERLLVITLFILAAVVRLATIHCGTNVDEGVYWVEGREITKGYLIYRDTQFNKTPLVAFVSAPFFLLGSTPILPMRVVMIAFSLLALCAVYRLAKELFGPSAALATLVLMALEPYSCVWAKYLHTSTWAPWFEAGVFLLLIPGLKHSQRNWITASGVLLGIYALSKQSAIFVLVPGICAWFLFAPERNIRSFVTDMAQWAGGVLLVLAPFFLLFALAGALEELWHDIWTAHHKMAGAFADHTTAFRWGEWRSMVYLAPVFWLLPFGSLLLLWGKKRRETLFVWVWLIVVFYGNTFFISHVWRHYFLVSMVPAAILAGAFYGLVVGEIEKVKIEPRYRKALPCVGAAVLAFGITVFWSRNDWFYPGLTLEQEKQLAAFVARACPEPYCLNLTNPAMYVWTDKEMPPAKRNGHTTRMPFFMTIAGRGYLSAEDMKNTVEGWRDVPIGCVIAYDKYLRQIMEDPLMQPLRDWLLEYFRPPRRVSVGESYYGWFFLFERKRE